MDTFLQLLALIAVITGTLFSLIGVIGLLRLPDVYTRLHATGKVGVYGAVLLLVAATPGASCGDATARPSRPRRPDDCSAWAR